MEEPRIVVSSLVVDSHAPDTLATFWYELLGGELVVYPQYGVVALRAPGITLDFVLVADTKSVKNRLHIDLASNNPEATIDRAIKLGATFAEDFGLHAGHTVLRDPEDNEFCVLHDMPSDHPWQPPRDRIGER